MSPRRTRTKGERRARAKHAARHKESMARQKEKCAEKKRYDTPAEAYEMARQYAQQAYLCRFCDGWHLASKRG